MSHTATMALSDAPDPVGLPVPAGPVTRAPKARPVHVLVPTVDGGEIVKDGFALAWTKDAVLVQVLWPREYYTAAREFWVDASSVSRRVIEPEWNGR
ncbi:hypothetical protein [Sinomonas atrocyanea]|uniref:hypothetical protein n=1 Tax=Sinomonas atrocyanea TaxID=37927 RepID=UPI00285991F7|nr:hypothetical protein [Sinomonas atrocyanea]MDR6623038.1 hypothetical protein [Sinomonas atrocyanea]